MINKNIKDIIKNINSPSKLKDLVFKELSLRSEESISHKNIIKLDQKKK